MVRISILDETLVRQLRELGPPEPSLLGSSQPAPTPASLREGRFQVYGHPATLSPPIDWRQDPHSSRSWRYQLHSFAWLTPTLVAHSKSGDRAPLAVALDVIADWISSHMESPADVSEFAWNDMAVSQRTPSLAYALRAGLQADLLGGDRAESLLQTCNRHGTELADEAKYSAGHNHGLAQDEALYLLARQLPVLPAAGDWSALALDRMRMTLGQTISEREGAHLEHSSAYQFAIAKLVSRLGQTVTELPELRQLRDRLRRTSAWHVTPAGRLAQLGDTDDTPAPRWATIESSRQHGMAALYEAGNAFVRDNGSYLAVSAGYHSSAHKHADDTGFLLIERGSVLLGDAGRWGYYEDEPDRRYARSAHAHNVLTVDDQGFDLRGSKPYGSGLLVASESDGWYVVLVTNPLLAAQGVAHLRLLLYRPGEALVAIDRVRAREDHEYVRRFHFGPGLEAHLDSGSGVTVRGPDLTAVLTDLSGTSAVELTHGQDQPVRAGWTYPSDRERTAVSTAILRCQGGSATLAAALTLEDADLRIHHATLDGDRALLETNRNALEIHLSPDERRAEVHLTRKT